MHLSSSISRILNLHISGLVGICFKISFSLEQRSFLELMRFTSSIEMPRRSWEESRYTISFTCVVILALVLHQVLQNLVFTVIASIPPKRVHSYHIKSSKTLCSNKVQILVYIIATSSSPNLYIQSSKPCDTVQLLLH